MMRLSEFARKLFKMSPEKPKFKQMFDMHVHEGQPQSFVEVLDMEKRPVSDHIRAFATKEGGHYENVEGPVQVPTRWYTDHNVYIDEVEKIWKKKWQMACRIEHVADVGDTFVYDVAGLSIIIVKAKDDELKAYWNSCLHRGVPLRKCSGNAGRALQCPFHGFTWSLEGKSIQIPHPEQFPQIDQENFNLPEVKIAVWKGFVFINPSPDAEPFEEYLGPLAEENHTWPYNMGFGFHVAKVFNGNWKSLQEAFMESYHVLTTHPQTVDYGASDGCSEFGMAGNISVGVLSLGLSNEYLSKTPEEQYIYNKMNEIWDDEETPPDMILPDGMTAREKDAQKKRENLRPILGDMVDEISDTEVSDIFYWTVFPNFHPFGIYTNPLVYSFRPYGNNPDKSIMEIYFLKPLPEGTPPIPTPKRILLSEEEEYSSIKELAYFGAFIAQDSDNMNSIMDGLRANQLGYVNLAHKYEGKIRHFYKRYQEEMGLSAADEVAKLKAR